MHTILIKHGDVIGWADDVTAITHKPSSRVFEITFDSGVVITLTDNAKDYTHIVTRGEITQSEANAVRHRWLYSEITSFAREVKA